MVKLRRIKITFKSSYQSDFRKENKALTRSFSRKYLNMLEKMKMQAKNLK